VRCTRAVHIHHAVDETQHGHCHDLVVLLRSCTVEPREKRRHTNEALMHRVHHLPQNWGDGSAFGRGDGRFVRAHRVEDVLEGAEKAENSRHSAREMSVTMSCTDAQSGDAVQRILRRVMTA
jgi:hypothetical protein